MATTSSNLKGTYIKTLQEAASSLAAGTTEFARRIRPACSTRTPTLVEARPPVLEEENEALRKELAEIAVSAPRECSRCGVSTFDSGHPPRNGQNDSNARLAPLERRVEELGPSIIRSIEDRLRGSRPIPEAGHRLLTGGVGSHHHHHPVTIAPLGTAGW
jgi:hypothetical protein